MHPIFSVTAPLMIRNPEGEEKVIAALFPHENGLLYFDLYWHQRSPEQSMHVLNGEITGEGPWKINDHILNVLGCKGTHSNLAIQFEQWREVLMAANSDYPPPPLIAAIARKMQGKL